MKGESLWNLQINQQIITEKMKEFGEKYELLLYYAVKKWSLPILRAGVWGGKILDKAAFACRQYQTQWNN